MTDIQTPLIRGEKKFFKCLRCYYHNVIENERCCNIMYIKERHVIKIYKDPYTKDIQSIVKQSTKIFTV